MFPVLALLAHGQEAVSLFNGKDLTGWTDAKGRPMAEGWKVEEGGVLHRAGKGGDLYTAAEYGDFELSWEWKVATGGNSGVKYRLATYAGKTLGPEYQMLDDVNHPDGKIGPHRQSASLYDLKPADPAVKKLHPAGEWNSSRIVAKGTVLEHWLNGVKVMSADTSSEEWKAILAKSKFKTIADFARNPAGRIHLQDHGDEAWFRNISIKVLPATAGSAPASPAPAVKKEQK